MEHKHAELLRMAADNADQLFECDDKTLFTDPQTIFQVLTYWGYNWRPVKQTKKIKRWLWTTHIGSEFFVSECFMTETEAVTYGHEATKLLWSETEFEVSDEI